MSLTVIDLIEAGDVPDGWVKYDVRLVSRFRDYWELVLERQRNQPDIPMPFHALGGDRDKIWERFTAGGQASLAKATTRLCSLDPNLHACLQEADFRRKARTTLVTIYFTPREQVMLCARLGLPVPETAEIDALRDQAEEFKARQKKGRDSRFKSDVLGGYYFTCALTGYRLDTETTSIVQAAHIHQHAISGNDDPNELYAIPEIRKFYQHFHNVWPYWFYFCDLHTETLQMMTLCLLPNLQGFKRLGEPKAAVEYDPLDLITFISKNFIPLNTMMERAGMSEMDI